MKFKILFIILLLCVLCSTVIAQDTVTVAWDANSETDLAGYKIYYGFSPDSLHVVIDVGNVTEYGIGELSPVVYYFAATAYDTSGNESDFSNIVSAALGEDDRKPKKWNLYFVGDTTAIDSVNFKLKYTCDNAVALWLNGVPQGGSDSWNEYITIEQKFPVETEITIMAYCTSEGYGRGFLGEIWFNDRIVFWSDTTWQVSTDNSLWTNANDFGIFRLAKPWANFNNVNGWELYSPSHWIWASGRQGKEGEIDGGDLAPLSCYIQFKFVIGSN